MFALPNCLFHFIWHLFVGVLTLEARGPSGLIETKTEMATQNRTKICFTPTETGEHTFRFVWNRIPLLHAPVLGIAYLSDENPVSTSKSRASSISSSGSGSDQKVVLTGKGLAKAITGIEADFTIDGSRAGPGKRIIF